MGLFGGGMGALIGGVGGAFLGGPAGAAVGASIGGAIDSSSAQAEANKQNRKMAENQMAFQERMSNTAYQRQMTDMEKAGLNPMLVTGMSGASSPTGATANIQSEAPDTQSVVANALQTANLKKELELKDEQKKNIEAATKKTQSEAKAVDASNEAAEIDAQFYKENPWFRKAEKVMNFLGAGASTIGSAKKIFQSSKPKNDFNNKKHYKVDRKTGELLN